MAAGFIDLSSAAMRQGSGKETGRGLSAALGLGPMENETGREFKDFGAARTPSRAASNPASEADL